MNQQETFERLTGEARESGLLKFCKDGVAVIILPLDADKEKIREVPSEPMVVRDRIEGRQSGEGQIEGAHEPAGETSGPKEVGEA